MTASLRLGPRRDGVGPLLLRAALVVAITVPAALLFGQSWTSTHGTSTTTNQERDGVAYLQSLLGVEVALTNAESAAVAGQAVPKDALTQAVNAHNGIEQRLGAKMRSQQRWTQLRDKISALPTRLNASPSGVYSAYVESSGLLLSLFEKVRLNSGLSRDPDADAYYLEDGGARQLPQAIAAAARYTDLVVLATTKSGADLPSTLAELTLVRGSLASNGSDLSDDVRLAVDASANSTIGSDLINRLDKFQSSVDALIPATALQGHTLTVTAEQVLKERNDMQSAASDLSTNVLSQVDQLLRTRGDSLSSRLLTAFGELALVVLLAAVPLLILLARRRRSRHGARRAATREEPASRGARTGVPAGHNGMAGTPGRAAPVNPTGVADPRQAAADPYAAPAPPWPGAPQPDPGLEELARWERFRASQ